MNGLTAYNFPAQVAWKTLNLLVERKGLIYPTGTAFYVWQRSNRVIVAFDPSAIQLERVNEDFAHALSTRLHGRRVPLRQRARHQRQLHARHDRHRHRVGAADGVRVRQTP